MANYTQKDLERMRRGLVAELTTNVHVTVRQDGLVHYEFIDPGATGPSGMRRPNLTRYGKTLNSDEAQRYIKMGEMIENPHLGLMRLGKQIYGFVPTSARVSGNKILLADNPAVGMGEPHAQEVDFKTARQLIANYFAKQSEITGMLFSLTNVGVRCTNYESLYNPRIGLEQVIAAREKLETTIRRKSFDPSRTSINFALGKLGGVYIKESGIPDTETSGSSELRKGRLDNLLE